MTGFLLATAVQIQFTDILFTTARRMDGENVESMGNTKKNKILSFEGKQMKLETGIIMLPMDEDTKTDGKIFSRPGTILKRGVR